MALAIQEYINNIHDPVTQRNLQLIFEALDTEIDAIRTIANELRDDHATVRTELIAIGTTLASVKTAVPAITDTSGSSVPPTLTAPAATESLSN